MKYLIYYIILFIILIIAVSLFLGIVVGKKLKKRKSETKQLIESSSSRIELKYRAYFICGSFLIIGILSYYFGYYLESDTIYYVLSKVLKDFGSIFIAIALVDFFQKYFMQTHFHKEIINNIRIIAPLFDSYHLHGIEEVTSRLPEIDIIRKLIQSAKHVIIVQTFIPGLEMFQDAIIKAFEDNDNFRLEIFLLNPGSILAGRRSEVITPNPGRDIDLESVKKHIETNQDSFKTIKDSLDTGSRSQFHLYYYDYDLLPSVSIYKFDDIAYIGFYMYGAKAVESPQLKVNCKKGIGLQFIKHLQYLRTYPNGKVYKKMDCYKSKTLPVEQKDDKKT